MYRDILRNFRISRGRPLTKHWPVAFWTLQTESLSINVQFSLQFDTIEQKHKKKKITISLLETG